jgi:regulator of protease activity HflC (stomatin/prohibitin superfamily)
MSTTGKLIVGGVGVVLAFALVGGNFTTIQTGENGLYRNFDGKISDTVLQPGIHFDGLGSIPTFNTRKITVSANDMRPKTKDNTIMKEMDVTVTYSLSPSSLYAFYTGYDMSNHGVNSQGQIQLMASYIQRLITSATNQSVDEFGSLEVNSKLEQIQDAIKMNLTSALEKNGLGGKIIIDSVIVGKADLPDELVSSVNKVVTAQSEFKVQEQKTMTAKSKAEENAALAATATPQSLEYMRLQAMQELFRNGNIEKVMIINGAKMDFMPGNMMGGK